MQANCPRCGAALTADTTEWPVCAYGDIEEIVLLEVQRPGTARPAPRPPSPLPRVFAGLTILVVVIAVISAALR